MFIRISLLFVILSFLSACTTNPVTGKSEFSLVSPQQEVSIGAKNFVPYQQQQGGQYLVDPEVNLYVSQVGKKLAAVSDRPGLPFEFVVLNNDVPNAWALPGGKIAINRGLLVQLKDEAQLAAVLSHEIVHAAAKHGAQQMTQQKLLGIGVGVIGYTSSKNEYGKLISAGTAIGAAAWQARHGRQHELDSDYYGMHYMAKAGYDPYAAVELQQLFVSFKSKGKSNWLNGLFASHPPSAERVQKNRETAATLSGNIRNRTQFQYAIRQIIKDKRAYDYHNKAIELANKGENDKALKFVNDAIKMQNQEPQFYLTKGKLLLNKKSNSAAFKAFKQVNNLYPEYYEGYLGLGLASYKRKQYKNAEKYLSQSTKTVPTLTAVYYLGETSLSLGKKDQAIAYFQQAVKTHGELAEKAARRLQELQPPQNTQ